MSESCKLVIQVAQSELDVELVKTILSEYRIHNADVTLRCDATSEDLIDVIEGNRCVFDCLRSKILLTGAFRRKYHSFIDPLIT